MSKTEPPDRRGVDELRQDAGQDDGGPAAKAQGPEQALEVDSGGRPERELAARGAPHAEPGALLGDEEVARLDLLHGGGHDVTHRGLAAARDRGDADAGHLEAGRSRARAVDRVDDEDDLGVVGALEAAVLGVEGPAGKSLAHVGDEEALGLLVDAERHVAPDRDPGMVACGVRAERRQHHGAQPGAEVDEAVESVVHAASLIVAGDEVSPRRDPAGDRGVHCTLLYSRRD